MWIEPCATENYQRIINQLTTIITTDYIKSLRQLLRKMVLLRMENGLALKISTKNIQLKVLRLQKQNEVNL